MLIDFGSARQALGVQTQTLTTLVSPGYAPFEQYYSDSNQQGPWTDIYALGATAFRAITGRAPMPAVDRSKALLHEASDFVSDALDGLGDAYSATFRRAVAQAIAFREKDRPQTIAAWRALLEGHPIDEDEVETVKADAAAAAVADAGHADASETATEVLPRTGGAAPTATFAPTEVLAQTGEPAPAPSAQATVQTTGAAATAAATQGAGGRKKWVAVAAVVLVAGIALAAFRPRPEPDAPAPAAPAPEPVVTTPAPAAPAATTPTNVAATPAPTVPAPKVDDRTATLRRLLEGAQRDLRADRLVRPPGDNALEKLRNVQRLEPDNWEAGRGLERIVERKVQLAGRAAESGDLAGARVHLDEAASIDPTHPGIAAARTRLSRVADVQTTLSERLKVGAEKLTDEKSRRVMRQAKKALEKKDLSKALDLLDRLGKD